MKIQNQSVSIPGSKQIRVSVSIIVRKEKKKKDGTSPVFLQLIQNRVVRKVSLDLCWPPEFFDSSSQSFLSRYKGDPDVADMNLALGNIKAKINRIQLDFRIKGRELSAEDFLHDFNSF